MDGQLNLENCRWLAPQAAASNHLAIRCVVLPRVEDRGSGMANVSSVTRPEIQPDLDGRGRERDVDHRGRMASGALDTIREGTLAADDIVNQRQTGPLKRASMASRLAA